MGNFFQNILLSIKRGLPFSYSAIHPTKESERKSHPAGRGRPFHSLQKQAEIDLLCNKLFTRKDLITSGKLQFLGLADVKKRLGRRWQGLSKVIYDIVERVMSEYLDAEDIYLPYRDDSYILIFSQSTLESGQKKAELISLKIQEELFLLEDADLKKIEIYKIVTEINASQLLGSNLPDVLDVIDFSESENKHEQGGLLPVLRDEKIGPIKTTEVSAKNLRRAIPNSREISGIPTINFSYLPLWDTKRNALTTYICTGCREGENNNIFSGYENLFSGEDFRKKALIDIAILEKVASRLTEMEESDKKIFIICPLQHETVFHFETYEQYKKALLNIPVESRKYLILLVMNSSDCVSPKNIFWFTPALKGIVRHLYVQVPMRQDINFQPLCKAGFDAVGVLVEKQEAEQGVLNALKSISARSRSFKIPKSFVLNLSTLSLTTSAVCAGFDFIGGEAIHPAINHPDMVQKFKHEDLLTMLGQPEAVPTGATT